jgi:hypothetical protein
MLMKPEVLRRALSDARSGQVVFVSHCMLNQNVRYQGGATRPERSTRWWQGCSAPGWASSRCRARSSPLGVGWTSSTPCPRTGLIERDFAGCAARPAGCSCSTHVWPTAVSQARSLAKFVITSGPANPYRRCLGSALAFVWGAHHVGSQGRAGHHRRL